LTDDILAKETTPRDAKIAALMLVLATVFWGFGFTWAKDVGDRINAAAGMAGEAMLGPVVALSVRFFFGAVLWLAIFPSARRGWTIGTLWRGGVIGGFLSAAVIAQHVGLTQTSAATMAFLTSLTVVIVPLMIAVGLRRLPRKRVVLAVAVATAGIWLLTGAKAERPSVGELYGIACATFYSVQLILLNILAPGDNPMRLTPAIFLVSGVISVAAAFVAPGHMSLPVSVLATPHVAIDLALLTIFSTLVSFGSMTIFQPRIDPTRATLIYMLEPIFAAAYAWVARGETMTPAGAAGAALILLANFAAEIDLFRRSES